MNRPCLKLQLNEQYFFHVLGIFVQIISYSDDYWMNILPAGMY